MKFTSGVRECMASTIRGQATKFVFKPGFLTVAVIPMNKLKSFDTLIKRFKRVQIIGEPFRVKNGWLTLLYRGRAIKEPKWLEWLRAYCPIVLDLEFMSFTGLKAAVRGIDPKTLNTMIKRRILETLITLSTFEEAKEDEEEELEM